jgi:hypothetical protein
MATYAELYDLRTHSALRNKITVAIGVKAAAILDSASPTAAQVTWAKEAIENPQSKADAMLNYLLASNASATTGQITGALDAAIQTKVNTAVDTIITGGT